MPSTMSPNWLDLDGVANMRDLGGLPTHDGRRIALRRLIRSDNLRDLTRRDVERVVGELQVTQIIDLRTADEVVLEGRGPLEATNVGYHQLSLFPDHGRTVTMADALALPAHSDRHGSRDATFWAHHYLRYLAGRPESVTAAVRIVASAQGATIVHCAAGKDRTGTLVAVLLDLAGVPHEEIVADYLATADRIPAILARLGSRPAYAAALADQPISDQVPRAQTMVSVLDALATHGGAAGWLRDHGMSPQELAAARSRLLD